MNLGALKNIGEIIMKVEQNFSTKQYNNFDFK